MAYSEAQYIIDEASKTGGLVPKPAKNAKVKFEDGVAKITFKVEDSVIEDHTVCYIGKVLIVRKVGTAPVSPEDGTVVATITREHMNDYNTDPFIDDTIESGIRYGYSIFTVSDHGVINIKAISVLKMITRFAYYHDFTDANPDTCITYLDWGDLDSSAEPIHTNSATGTVTYGSFEDYYVLKKNKPYMVKTDWTADYALDPDDYTKKLDGSISDVSFTSYSGLGAYAWIPKFYMKEVYDSTPTNGRTVYFSNEKEDSDFYPVGFYDYNVGEVEGIWIPMYYVGSDGKSFAGRTGYNGLNNKSCDNQKTIIDKAGANARFLGGSIMNAYRDLCYGLYKSTNIQEHGGYGNCNGYISSDAYFGMTTNPVLSNGAVSGFYGTGTSSDDNSRKQANKAFHSNVLFTYDMFLRDPYTLAYMFGSSDSSITIRTTNRYSPTGGQLQEDVYTSDYRARSAGGGCSLKLESINTKRDSNSIPSSINYGDNLGSTSTGLCDYASWPTSSGIYTAAKRLGFCSYGQSAGPAYIDLSSQANNTNAMTGAAPMLIPPSGYSPE